MPTAPRPVDVVAFDMPQLTPHSVAHVAEQVEKLQHEGAAVVIDLAIVRETRADGLAALLAWTQRDRPDTHHTVFAAAQGDMLSAICQTRMQREVRCYASVEAACAALRS